MGANDVQLPAWIPTPYNAKFRRTMRALHTNVLQIIAAARASDRAEGTLLAMLLDTRDEQGWPLPDDAIRDEVFTLFLAGHETTALTLTWMFVLLDQQRLTRCPDADSL